MDRARLAPLLNKCPHRSSAMSSGTRLASNYGSAYTIIAARSSSRTAHHQRQNRMAACARYAADPRALTRTLRGRSVCAEAHTTRLLGDFPQDRCLARLGLGVRRDARYRGCPPGFLGVALIWTAARRSP